MWTKMDIFLVIALLYVIVQYNVIHAKRILFIASIPSYSHQISYRNIYLELNKRGHEIVLFTTDPVRNSSLTNYTEVDLSNFYVLPEYKTLSYRSLTEASMNSSFLDVEHFAWDIGFITSNAVFKHPEIKKLYAADSNEHFDAVIIAQGHTAALNAFAYRFKAPLIGVSSLDVFNQYRYMLGGLILPSHLSNWQSNIQIHGNISFWERLVNFYDVWMQMYHWANVRIPSDDALVKKYLGEGIPSVLDITQNMSLYFINKNPIISYPRQEQSNIMFYHGFHIAAVPPALPKELKQLLDNATEGFIYVSLGTNVRWDHLPKNTLETFTEAFTSLPWKILWKNNPDLIPNKFENIFVSKWFPQQSILAHSNIKLFIYQGGVQSTEEAVYHGVPVIGYPIIWDQKYQVQNVMRLGMGAHLDYKNLSKENIVTTVYEVINNKRYQERAKEVSKLYKDIPYDTLQNVVWWIEYTMRHNGVTWLQDRICDKPWYQRYDWDIIGFLAIVAFTTFFIFLYTLFQILHFICERYRILYDDTKYYHTKSKTQ
ncbi:PREDICTED: UDP-glucuronosyltransferase 2B18-like [Dinoponera quadriceps]|uniref:UDP-glucuronosyltransferase 2B18-like n=1 Tax=Dinoponera quadriceps TaxID=609295 RepID=A0A6P3XV00_DINQU|nr:PREDICTED: UDP-glucuronosyltransferase 2B18-like [Dinoponera quadriceps]